MCEYSLTTSYASSSRAGALRYETKSKPGHWTEHELQLQTRIWLFMFNYLIVVSVQNKEPWLGKETKRNVGRGNAKETLEKRVSFAMEKRFQPMQKKRKSTSIDKKAPGA